MFNVGGGRLVILIAFACKRYQNKDLVLSSEWTCVTENGFKRISAKPNLELTSKYLRHIL